MDDKRNCLLPTILKKMGHPSLALDDAYKDLQLFLSAVNGIAEVDVDKNMKAIFIDYLPDKITHDKIEELIAQWNSKQ